jgi:hypothetical protein
VVTEALVAPEVLVVTEADLANDRGVQGSVEGLLVTANAPLVHPLTMPPLAATIPPGFSLRYIGTTAPHPTGNARRVRIFSLWKIPRMISGLPLSLPFYCEIDWLLPTVQCGTGSVLMGARRKRAPQGFSAE